ncbi:MAG TPA: murein biosynthesis integral membrane protein MurJ [Rhabdochlamydiaceae bacterium]|nr:murein biosynthesis integral membrane protein MurJ [Rhabdochlamydiaceae bacterium]
MIHSQSSLVRRFFSGTLLSRASGMGRDLAMAFAFGDHPAVAAFMIAFRLSNLFRRLLGEGPLQSVLIPHFEGLRVKDSASAAHFFRNLTFLLVILLIFITLFSETILLSLLNFFQLSVDNQEIIQLTAWMFPGLIFICLYGINISALQCYESFFLPSFAPFVCNLIWIGGALYFRNAEPSLAMIELSKLVVVGFFFQWLITFPLTAKNITGNIKQWLIHKMEVPPEIKQLIKAFGFGMVVIGATQINGFLDALFARYADLKGPVYLWYSIRIEQLALAIFGMACVNTIVPSLSRAISAGNKGEAQMLFSLSYRRILTVMVPCTCALIFLGASSIDLIYGRGHFSDFAVSQTTLCLWAYGIGLIPSTFVLLFFAVLYAQKNFRIAGQIALGTIFIHILLNSFFIFGLGLGAISTALATSISSWIQSIALGRILFKESWKADRGNLLHLIGATLFASCALFLLDSIFFNHATLSIFLGNSALFPKSTSDQLILFLCEASCYIGSLFLYAFFFKNKDLLILFKEFTFTSNSK